MVPLKRQRAVLASLSKERAVADLVRRQLCLRRQRVPGQAVGMAGCPIYIPGVARGLCHGPHVGRARGVLAVPARKEEEARRGRGKGHGPLARGVRAAADLHRARRRSARKRAPRKPRGAPCGQVLDLRPPVHPGERVRVGRAHRRGARRARGVARRRGEAAPEGRRDRGVRHGARALQARRGPREAAEARRGLEHREGAARLRVARVCARRRRQVRAQRRAPRAVVLADLARGAARAPVAAVQPGRTRRTHARPRRRRKGVCGTRLAPPGPARCLEGVCGARAAHPRRICAGLHREPCEAQHRRQPPHDRARGEVTRLRRGALLRHIYHAAGRAACKMRSRASRADYATVRLTETPIYSETFRPFIQKASGQWCGGGPPRRCSLRSQSIPRRTPRSPGRGAPATAGPRPRRSHWRCTRRRCRACS